MPPNSDFGPANTKDGNDWPANDAAEPPSTFDIAAARAQARFTVEQWALLEPGRRSSAIYTELRRIDALRRRAAE